MKLEGWRDTRLGEVVEPQKGLQTGPFGSQLHASDYVCEGIPVVMPRDLAGNVISDDVAAHVSPDTAAQLERYRLRPGDVLFARRGQIGRCALVTPAQDGWLCGTGCLRARLASSVCPEFLIQLMQWPATVAWMTENAVGQTMQNLNTRILAALPLRIPALSTQLEIAEIIGSVDDTIAATRRVIEQTATVKEGFLRRLFSRGLGRSVSPEGSKLARACHNGSGREMPAGWQLRRIGDLCSFTNGRGFKASEWSEQGLPIIRIQNLNGSTDFKLFGGAARDRWIVEEGDLLFAWAGVKGTSFGPYLWRGPRGVLNQHIYRVQPREEVVKLWLFESLRQVTHEIEERAQGFKSSLLHVRKVDITAHEIAVPPRSEQVAIAEHCQCANEMEEVEMSNLEAVLRLKQALMDDLFSGRVTVDGAPKPKPSA